MSWHDGVPCATNILRRTDRKNTGNINLYKQQVNLTLTGKPYPNTANFLHQKASISLIHSAGILNVKTCLQYDSNIQINFIF